MSTLGRKLHSGITGAAVSLALVLFAFPLAAQKTSLTLASAAVTFPAPTASDYINGFVDAPTGMTFTINSTQGLSRTTTVSIRSISANLGGGKVIADLQWRRSDLATWNSITLTDAQIEQRIAISKGLNDPWSNTIFFRMVLNWTTDAPATYSGTYQITLSQTVP
ncbi:MAG TPA: hypothetical protein VK542_06035 [Gemmatimonadaceae bacterium]|nr:hypothetical protein [Gemmatimonadaceae bacterium]